MGDKNNYAKAIEYILLAQKEYDGVELTGSDKNGLVNILLDLSYYYIKNTQYQEALNTSNKILKLGVEYRPSSKSIALNNKGAALDSLGKMNQGKGYYEQALAIDYELAVANDNLDYVNQLSYALDRMYSNAMTVVDTIDDFNAYDDLQRQHAAKYLSILAKKIFKKVPNKKTVCKFTDLTKADKTMRPFIVEACQLGLLGGVK
jgi:tetratricopeptide (TPR) repeat protein